MRVAIIGTGYVGLTTGVCLSFIGHQVSCLDTDEAKIKALKDGHIPIYEPSLAELMEEARPNLTFTSSYAEAIPGAEVVFIAVGTPPTPSGAPNLEYLSQAARSVGQYLGGPFHRRGQQIDGAHRQRQLGGFAAARCRSSSGRTRPGSSSRLPRTRSSCAKARRSTTVLYPDRIVIGADEQRALEVLYSAVPAHSRPDVFGADISAAARDGGRGAAGFDRSCFGRTDQVRRQRVPGAENQLHQRNRACWRSAWERISPKSRAASGSIRGSATGFCSAGIGWGGSCFGKDTAALIATAGEYGLHLPIVEAAKKINSRQRDRVVEKAAPRVKNPQRPDRRPAWPGV